MQLSDYDLLSQEEKNDINAFVEANIETIFDERKSYKTYVNLNVKHLEVNDNPDTEELVDTNFVGYWCNQCNMYIDPRSDIGLIVHVLKHIRGEQLEDESDLNIESVNELRNKILEQALAVDELHTHTSIGDE